MANLNKIIRNSLHFLSSNLINLVLGLISSVILARSLHANNLGVFHQVLWFSGLVSTLISLGFITCIIKFSAEYKAKGLKKNIASLTKFIVKVELAITLLSSVALIFMSTSIADHYFSPDQSILFVISFLAITPGMQTAIFSALLEGNQIFKYQNIHSMTVTPIAILTKITLMMTGFGVTSLLVCNLAFSIVNLIYYYYAVKKEQILPEWSSIEPLDPKSKKDVLNYNRSVFSIVVIDLIVWSRSENYFLGRYCSAAQVAYYNIAQNLIHKFTGIIPTLMWKMLLPLASENEGKNNLSYRKKTYFHAVRYSAFILFPLITLCFIGAYELIVIFYGQEYSQVQICFQIMCVGALITSLTQPGSAIIYATNKQGFIFWYGLVLAFLNIGLDIWLIPKYQAIGASICFTITTSLGALGGFFFLTTRLKLKIPLIAISKIAFCCSLMGFSLYWLIRIDSSYFNHFNSLIHSIKNLIHINTEIIFGPRTIRLIFGFSLSSLLYLYAGFLLFTPEKDDLKILNAIKQYLPKRLMNFLLRRDSLKNAKDSLY